MKFKLFSVFSVLGILSACNSMTNANTTPVAANATERSTVILAEITAPKSGPLAVPASAKVVVKLPAIGVQIYKCTNAKGPFTWDFVAPEADLFDVEGKMVGRHGAGPFWEMSDGSKINGTVAGRENSIRPNAIPHLLLTTKSNGGQGRISSVTHLQRINTVGGTAPAAGCAVVGDLDKQVRVFYTADYLLFSS
jgi:Protein of unknown function (DUF3455)